MRILVTGGAGYIGSHMVKLLGERGYEVLTVDNLSEGNSWAVLYGDLKVVDLLNYKALEEVLLDFRPQAVIHFAAKVKVPESVKKPLLYYENNFMGTVNLLQAMERASVKYLIFLFHCGRLRHSQKRAGKGRGPNYTYKPLRLEQAICREGHKGFCSP